jgi:diguanylate cyclase (GGDEF)-like protein
MPRPPADDAGTSPSRLNAREIKLVMTTSPYFRTGLPENERQTILVVDDSPLLVATLSATLATVCNILAARGGEEAIAVARDQIPDLILLDVMMPGLDGFEACARLKADPRTAGIPVIFITGLDAKEDELRALSLGAIDFIQKPVHTGVLVQRVRNHLELKRYRDFLENLSLLDGLTGVGNRRRFDETLDREWRQAKRHRQPLSLVLLDVDHFKKFNDLYGHQWGDECLRRVAHTLRKTLHRPSDVVARFGGEEFAAILPETDQIGTRNVASRMREAVVALDIPHAASSTASHVTASLGLACVLPWEEEASPAELVRLADENLYEAKRAGRNQVR